MSSIVVTLCPHCNTQNTHMLGGYGFYPTGNTHCTTCHKGFNGPNNTIAEGSGDGPLTWKRGYSKESDDIVPVKQEKSLSTQYNVYDTVWAMKNNQATKLQVFAVIVSMDHPNTGVEVHYHLVSNQCRAEWENNEGIRMHPAQIFATKEELLQSL